MSARRCAVAAALAFMAASLTAGAVHAAVVTVNYINPGDGFHSTDPPDPVSTAPGATLGEQRKASFEAAAAEWGARLTSNVAIVVDADMTPLTCNGFSAVLGGAGPLSVFRDWSAGAGGDPPAHAATWYHSALANKIANVDIAAGNDVGATFNSSIDNNDNCLTGTNWFYGVTKVSAPPSTIAFYDVVLHEIGHGIGVSTFVGPSGARFLDFDDIYMRFLEDHSTGLTWNNMTDSERAASAIDSADLHWVGPAVQAGSAVLTEGLQDGHVRMYAPDPYQGGSSVSHFDTALGASGDDELMEPFATGNEAILLTDDLLEDEGWGPVLGGTDCGSGTLEPPEECDDGDEVAGDGCSEFCQGEVCFSCDAMEPTNCTPETGTACDDGIVCTTDTCNAGVCESDPASCELDHFKLYKVKAAKNSAQFGGATVSLDDQFELKQTNVGKPVFLGNPADKNAEGISAPEFHLECYKIKDVKEPKQAKFTKRRVQTTNQFGTEELDVIKPVTLCVPSARDLAEPPSELPGGIVDHFKCYKAKTAKGQPKFIEQIVSLQDQFETKQTLVFKPSEICNPVDKNGEGVAHPADHLECYKIKDVKEPAQPKFTKTDVFVNNQFGDEKLTAVKPQRLCVPSTKTEL